MNTYILVESRTGVRHSIDSCNPVRAVKDLIMQKRESTFDYDIAAAKTFNSRYESGYLTYVQKDDMRFTGFVKAKRK